MAAPPPYSLFASTSPSRTSPDDVWSGLETTLCSSFSRNPSSTKSILSTATTLPTSSFGPDWPMTQNNTPTAVMHLPGSESSWSTRERLRLAELERDELRRAVEGERARASEMQRLAEEERAIAERLKREGGASGCLSSISAIEAKLRVLQLERDVRMAGAELPRRSTAGLFKSAYSTDLLFLIDTTSSMTGEINAAKEQVKSIVKDIKAASLNEAEVRIAVVGYKDHGDTDQIQFLDFTPSADQVHSFLNELVASGGSDVPEDVLGGIQQALNATWEQQTRCIIHIADAPPHGHTFNDSAGSVDYYPTPGSEPHGLTHEPLLKQMIELQINYALLRINSSTDRMALAFLIVYAAASADCKLHKFNKYYNEACHMSVDSRNSFRSGSRGGLLFEEATLGTAFSELRRLVVRVVTDSASRTAVRWSASTAQTLKEENEKNRDSNLAAIKEDEDYADDAQLERTRPKWNAPRWLDETLVVEGFSPDVLVHSASTLNDMMAHDDNIIMSTTELTIHKRSQNFAQGATRVVSYARTVASTNRFVVKSFKRGGKRIAHLAEDMRSQALCKAFALEFNALSGEEHSIDFIVTTCLRGKHGMTSGDECMSLEPFIEGPYVKYNNNCGYINDDNPTHWFNQAAQAFSHFTFERSRGRFLVCDLQGVGDILTDPAIHTLDPERFQLADTNLGPEGFKFFFATHVCNGICRKLKLKSNAQMFMSGKDDFRQRWPRIDTTVCCSNKLCGRIVRLASANRTAEFPGFNWCDVCWPQLRSSVVTLICIAPGPHHEFDASKFFHESQGRGVSRVCPEHREHDVAAPRNEMEFRSVVEGGNLWNRLKVVNKKKSLFGKSR